MQYGYLLKISNKNIYKEVQIPVDAEIMKIGMGIDCDVRFYKESFFEDFELVLQKKSNEWNITCSDNVFIDAGDVRKLITKKLSHGDSFAIKYQKSENEVFKIDFVYDFDNENKDYSRVIDITSKDKITIGNSSSCNICINSEYVKDDFVELNKKNEDLILAIKLTTCGVYHNGNLAVNGEVIKNGDFFSIADFSFFYKSNKLYTDISEKLKSNLTYRDSRLNSDYPKFTRNTRLKNIVNEDSIEILDPPVKPEKQRNNLLTRLLPSVGMMAVCIVMAIMSANKGISMVIFSAVSGVMGIITGIVGVVQNKKEFNKKTIERKEKYNSYIENKIIEIEEKRTEEIELLNNVYISNAKEQDNINSFSSHLFDRTPEDDDFLVVNLGTGKRISNNQVNYKKQEKLEINDELQAKPEELFFKYRYIENAPIICDLKENDAVGIVGKETQRYDILKNIVIDLCARQFYSDLNMIFVSEEVNARRLYELRLLPHVFNDKLNICNIVSNEESKNIIFEYLYKELNNRIITKTYDKRLVVFLYDNFGFENHPLSKFVKNAKEFGVTFIFFANSTEKIPLNCNKIIQILSENSASLINVSNKLSTNFNYISTNDKQFKKIIDLLAPIYTEEISLEGTLTKNISLFKMLNILAVDDIDLGANWESSKVFKSMAAPLGVSKSGIVNLDLHDKAHGPHGLVAGTTGSGKSEILQTYILSMATLFHPYEVGFVIIDFKGGGMVNQFRNLPHLVGAITNIDGKEIDRSLKSIKAELQKRQRLFAEVDVNHIDKYIKKFKVGEATTPLPHLILIVDEFAELKAEQPEFMKELISAARIGRSLGVHLILATQKPSGQVDDQIWSNSRFKLCLKVQDQADSNEVLKSPLAAEIKEPGRAYLQVGNNEIFELFQSAYSGASEKTDNSNFKEFSIFEITSTGKRVPVFVQKKKKSNEENRTQLEAIANFVQEYAKNNNIEKLPDICLPSLKKKLHYPKNIKPENSAFPVGVYDDPDNQYQGNAYLNIDDNNTLILGASQTGKTNILQLLIREISDLYTPEEANIYIVDFGSMILKSFESLNHVGGVVLSSEEEKLKNLFKLLLNELAIRKQKLLDIGVSSYNSYVEAGYHDVPRIYLIIDNFSVFKELYGEKFEDDFLYLSREGVAYGITLVVTNASSNGFGYRYLSNFSSFLTFSCNDVSEYSNVFDRCRIEPTNTAGRALFCQNKTIFELQTFLSFDGEKEIDRINQIKNYISSCNADNSNMHAKLIPSVPDDLSLEYIQNNFNIDIKNQLSVALDYQNVEPVIFDVNNMAQLSLIGKNFDSIALFEKAILNEIKLNYFDRETQVYIIDSLKRNLKDYSESPFVEQYTIDYTKLNETFESILETLESRYDKVLENGIECIENEKFVVVIINGMSAIEHISNSKELMNQYNLIVSKFKNMKIMLIFGEIEDANIGYSSPELLKKIKENKHAFIFSNLPEHKIFDFPIQFTKHNKKPIDKMQGFYVNETDISKIRFAKED